MKIAFMQTADPVKYRPFIEVTSPTVREFCARHELEYDCFIGVKRGARPWHAALNRIVMLNSRLDEGYRGWVIYLDADAYIADLGFDLPGYLADKDAFALIAAPSGVQPQRWWDINNGVFALNLGHEAGQDIVRNWFAKLQSIPLDALHAERAWSDVADDQAMLQAVLREQPGMEELLLRDTGPDAVFNWNARFIRQVVRSAATTLTRLEKLQSAVRLVLTSSAVEAPVIAVGAGPVYEEIVTALYRVLLMRDTDPRGLAASVARLGIGGRTLEDELKALLVSEEFRLKLPDFIARYFDPNTLERILAARRSTDHAAAAKAAIAGAKAADVFRQKYEKSGSDWGGHSGEGSRPYHTIPYRAFLERFLAMNQIRSVVDIGCGDWAFSRFVNFDRIDYTGLDVVPGLIERNQERFGGSGRRFALMPDDPAEVPRADLLIMKDVLQHLPNAHIDYFRRYVFPGFRCCLLTNSFRKVNTARNADIGVGGFRCLDLTAPPFSFPGSYVLEFHSPLWEEIRTLLYVP